MTKDDIKNSEGKANKAKAQSVLDSKASVGDKGISPNADQSLGIDAVNTKSKKNSVSKKSFIEKSKKFLADFKNKTKRQYASGKKFMSEVSAEAASYNPEIENQLLQQVRGPVKFGFIAIFSAIMFFLIWGSIAPLDKAVVAPGTIIVSGKTKDVQHLEGGIIEEILVSEGDFVDAGQKLLKMRDTQAKSNLQKIYYQLVGAKALEMRLIAEQKYQDNMDLEDEIFNISDPKVQQIIQTQYDQLRNRQSNLINREEIHDQKIAQYNEQINGLESQKKSILTQQQLVSEETESVQSLFDKGLANKPRLNQLLRTLKDLEGRHGEVIASIASAREAIAQTKLERINLRSEYEKEINEMLRDTQIRSNTLEREYESATDIAERTTIVASVSGIVSNLNYFTKGAVVSPGSQIMTIVPQDNELIIEAKVQPKDIQSVRVGLKAKVQLSAFKTRIVPRINGNIIYVSADKTDGGLQRSQASPFPEYYVVRIRISEEDIERINQDITLAPGMPASVFIVKGSRTFLQYLLGPFLDSFHRAFKEE